MQPSRRTYLASLGATAAVASLYPPAQAGYQAKGNIKQSVCQWCYGKMKLETLCEEVVKIGFKSIELLVQPEILKVKKYA